MKRFVTYINTKLNLAIESHPLLVPVALCASLLAAVLLVVTTHNKLLVLEGNVAARETVFLAAKVKHVFSHGTYHGLDSTALIDGARLPSVFVAGDRLINRFGGTIEVFPTSVDGKQNNAFVIRQFAVPRVACESLVRAFRNAGALAFRVYHEGAPPPHESDACVDDEVIVESVWQ